MKGLIITHPGLEAVSGKEIKELINQDCELERSAAVFSAEKLEDFCTLCYRSQSAIRVLYLFTSASGNCTYLSYTSRLWTLRSRITRIRSSLR